MEKFGCTETILFGYLAVVTLMGVYGGDYFVKDAARLHSDLLIANNYNRNVPPFWNNSAVEVNMILTVLEIKLDETEHQMITNAWLSYEWTDYRLRWDPDEYGTVSSLHIPENDIWLPDIELYNRAEYDEATGQAHSVVVRPNGYCQWIRPEIFRSNCPLDTTNYPNDRQSCLLKFGSWTYDGSQINLTTNDNVDISTYLESEKWALEETSAERNVVTYACCPEQYIDIRFNFRFQRRHSERLRLGLMMPCIVVFALSIIPLLLPPSSQQKLFASFIAVTSAIALYLCLILGMSLSTNYESYSLLLVGLTMLCLVMETLVIKLYHCDSVTKRMSVNMIKVTNMLATITLLRDYEPSKQLTAEVDNSRRSLKDQITSEWQLMAHAVNRICLLIYIFVALLGFLLMYSLC